MGVKRKVSSSRASPPSASAGGAVATADKPEPSNGASASDSKKPARAAKKPSKAKAKKSAAAAATSDASESPDEADEAVAAVESDADDEEPKAKKAKKAKKPKEPVKPLDPSLPTNLTVDPDLKPYDGPKQGDVRIVSWNVCGLKVAARKGFNTYVDAESAADVLCLQETRCGEPDFDNLSKRYPYRYWGVHPKKNYAGIAMLSKIEPKAVTYGFPQKPDDDDAKGRIVTLEFDNTFVIGTYVTNAGNGLKNMPLKEEWNRSFEQHIRTLESDHKKPIIWTGDLNCVPTDKDIRNWKTNYNKSAGCTQTEIDGYNSQLNPSPGSGHEKLVDVWRHLHPDLEGHYTYYSYKFQCRTKGIGWRLDSFIVSEQLVNKVSQCEIRQEIWGASDHVPIMLDIKGPL